MDMMPRYEKQSLSDMVVKYVKNEILSGTLKSGDRLIETDISAIFDISRAPVREAMRILNEQGIISFSPRVGNHVIKIEPSEIMELFEIRTTLEKQMLHKISREQLFKEKDFQQLMAFALEMKDEERRCQNEKDRVFLLHSLDLSFHKYLWELSGNVKRAQILESMFYQLLIMMNEDLSSPAMLEKKSEEHRLFAQVLRENELSAILHVFHNHIHEYVKATLPQEAQNFYLDC